MPKDEAETISFAAGFPESGARPEPRFSLVRRVLACYPIYGTGFDLGQAFNPRNNCLDFDQIVAALAQAGKVFRRSAPASCLSERSREEGLLRSRSEYALAQELLDEVPCSPLLLRAGACKPKLPSSCPFCPQGI